MHIRSLTPIPHTIARSCLARNRDMRIRPEKCRVDDFGNPCLDLVILINGRGHGDAVPAPVPQAVLLDLAVKPAETTGGR